MWRRLVPTLMRLALLLKAWRPLPLVIPATERAS